MRVPSAPLHRYIYKLMDQGEVDQVTLAARVGRSRTRVMDVLTKDTISIFTADLYCTALGVRVEDLYPEYRDWYPEARGPDVGPIATVNWSGRWYDDKVGDVAS